MKDTRLRRGELGICRISSTNIAATKSDEERSSPISSIRTCCSECDTGHSSGVCWAES